MTDIQKYDDQAPMMVQQQAGALGALHEHVAAMDAASKLATALCATDMVPKQYKNKPDDGAAAILYGAELGLNPIQSLQNVMVINGKPGVEARTMVAFLKTKGYLVETVESSDTRVTVRGTAPSGHVETSTWTIERAATAGYTSNALYKKIPAQMLYAKAATEVCRKLAPDVLLGIAYSTEELRLEQAVTMKAQRMDQPSRGSAGLRAALENGAAAQAEFTEADLSEEAARAKSDIDNASDQDELKRIMQQIEGVFDESEYNFLRQAGTARWRELPAAPQGQDEETTNE